MTGTVLGMQATGIAPREAAAACFHCGLSVPAGVDISTLVDGRRVPLCCHGCEAAVAFVTGAGLDDYYRLRERPTGIAADRDRLAVEAWSEPAIAERYVDRQGDACSATLALDGARCAACAWVIEQSLERLPGVTRARVDLASSRLEVQWTGAATELASLIERVQGLGFSSVPARGDAEIALHARQRRRSLRALGISGLCAMQIMMLAVADYAGFFGSMDPGYRALLLWAEGVLASVVIMFGAAGFFTGALRALSSRHLTLDVPVSLALAIAFGASLATLWSGGAARGEHVYFDSVAMFTFLLLLGRHLEMGVRHRFARVDHSLEALLPPVAARLRDDGGVITVPGSDLQIGDRVRVAPGETLPCDVEIDLGHSTLDCSAINGESQPLEVGPGQLAPGGAINLSGVLEARVHRVPADSQIAGVPELLSRARGLRPRTLGLADRAAGLFLFAVLVIAAGAGGLWLLLDPSRVVEVVIATLIVSCPCALSLAAPAALTAAGLRLRRVGALLVRPDALEALAEVDTVAFDKTGTLTDADRHPLRLEPLRRNDDGGDEDDHGDALLAVAARLERDVPHPLARAIRAAAAERGIETTQGAQDLVVHQGLGVAGVVEGTRWRLGRAAWIAAEPTEGTWLARAEGAGFRPVARLRVEEAMRPGSGELVTILRTRGLGVSLLSGDEPRRVDAVASALGIDDVLAAATPGAKLDHITRLAAAGRRVLYVGDGINDAPALGGSAVSMAMGSASDFSRTAADLVLLDDDIGRVGQVMNLALRARRTLRQNLGWAVGYNLCALPLAVAGLLTPWIAALGMSLSSLLVLGNSLRLLREGDG